MMSLERGKNRYGSIQNAAKFVVKHVKEDLYLGNGTTMAPLSQATKYDSREQAEKRRQSYKPDQYKVVEV